MNEPPDMPPTGTEAHVCADIAERQRRGVQKYGTTVSANPLCLREWMQHAYEEALDLAVYLRRALEEMEREGADHTTFVALGRPGALDTIAEEGSREFREGKTLGRIY